MAEQYCTWLLDSYVELVHHRRSSLFASCVLNFVFSVVATLENLLVIRALKEQYPVTAHAPNFDFWTGCREIKRCEESKRTLKNPFASRLAGINKTLKLLRITDQ